MISETPIETARRLRRRKDQHLCLQCGRRIQTEDHHPAGRQHDPQFTTALCQACHGQATEMLRRAGVDMRYTASSIERVVRSLKATAVFLLSLAEAHLRWAESLDLPKRRE
jgi:5-methylcytosine-specific restriction endonuclease McrA